MSLDVEQTEGGLAEALAEPTDDELAAIEQTPEERLAVLEDKVATLERRQARSLMEISSAIGRNITGEPPDY